MEISWKSISKSLYPIYEEHNITSHFEKDNSYLQKAFEFTSNLWKKQFNSIDKLNAVMLSEAPLFGDKQTYIYNPETNPTVFFYYSDLASFPTFQTTNVILKSAKDKKLVMYEHFTKNGFLFLDIFPFALNPVDTKINFQRMSKKLYMDLLNATIDCYLVPKLESCFKKTKGTLSFIYRYKRLFEKTESHVNVVLKEHFTDKKYLLKSVHGNNMSLDRDALAETF